MSEKKSKTKKVVKRRLKLKGVLFLLLFIGGLFVFVKFLLKVNVGNVYVSGNSYVKDALIIKDAGFNEDIAFLSFNSSKVCSQITNNPLIKTCKIKRTLDFKVKIEVTENIPVFFYTYENALMLSDGTRVHEANTYGIPTLINYVPEKVLLEFVSRLSLIKSDIIGSISEIEYSPSTGEDGTFIDEERFTMSMNDGNTVVINNKKMSILNYYDKIYASLGDKKGTYNFDCDFDNYLFTEYGDE